MDKKITYGVFWKHSDDDSFHISAGWFTKYNVAVKAFNECLSNPRCKAAQLIERVEHFEIITEKDKNEQTTTKVKYPTSDIPLDRLEEICKAYKEDRILILPKCPKCGLVNAWGIGKRNCDRCGALLYKQAEAALKESEDNNEEDN